LSYLLLVSSAGQDMLGAMMKEAGAAGVGVGQGDFIFFGSCSCFVTLPSRTHGSSPLLGVECLRCCRSTMSATRGDTVAGVAGAGQVV